MNTLVLRLPVGVLALSCCIGAWAQQLAPRELPFDRTEFGRLQDTDPRLSQHGPFHVYRVDLQQGQRILVSLESRDFDAYLVIGHLVAGIFDPLAKDDDGGGNHNARLRFRAPKTGTYLVLAQALGEQMRGAYALRASAAPEPTTGGVTDLAIGASVQGTLAETDREDEASGAYCDVYRMQVRAGQRLDIVLRSEAFDPYLAVGVGSEDVFIERASNDDAGGDLGQNSRLRYRVEEDGQQLIRVRSLRPGMTGPYTVAVTEIIPKPPQPARPLDPGADLSGEITDSDSATQDGRYYHEFYIDARAGQTLVVTHRSSDFDAYLVLGQGTGDLFRALASNDDSEGRNSRIEFRATESGRYVVRATTFGSASVGRYTVRAELRD